MQKRGLKKRQVIGHAQLILGIILLVVVLVGALLSSNSYKKALENNFKDVAYKVESLKKIQFSNDTKYLSWLSLAQYYSEQNSQIINRFINIGFTLIMLVIISILFITQGLVNSSERENGR